MASPRFCILGLGNPGARYRGTRHNIGFEWIDSVAQALFSGEQFREKYESLWLSGQISGCDVHLLKPQTFMNESGKALAAWKQKNQGEAKILAVYDDMDLPLGKLRLRYSGSDGGHRGLRSLIERGGSSEIPRLRLGIGRPAADTTVDFVLDKFHPDERAVVNCLLQDCSSHLKAFMELSEDQALQAINSKTYEGVKK
jgi:PTH1 family peptidyl-tRNA hydrolase